MKEALVEVVRMMELEVALRAKEVALMVQMISLT